MAKLLGKLTFKGGVHPPHSKGQTQAVPIEELPAPRKVVIPLSQHIGAPARATVAKGDRVKIGQVLGEPAGFVSAPVHASVSGTVTSVGEFPHPLGKHVVSVEIENDGLEEVAFLEPIARDTHEIAQGEIVKRVSEAGLVGMGGASFPTHVKLSPPSEKTIDTLIINGAECEPYLTADHRLMLEKTAEVLRGALLLKKALGSRSAIVAIEENKPDAIAAVSSLVGQKEFEGISLARLRAKYPQGGEKQLINAVTKRQVPSGGLPMDCGCVVQNVGTAFAVWDAVRNGIPLHKRVVTVTGPTVRRPLNLLVRIGTPIADLLAHCDTDMEATAKVIMGGPMMGLAQAELDAPVIKSTSGLLCHDRPGVGVSSHDCIGCGNCVKACPIHLVPSLLGKFVGHEKYEDAEEWNVLDCMECGSCAYVCPAKINLVHYMKLGKFHVMAARRARK